MGQVNIRDLPVEHPAEDAWKKYSATGDAYTDTTRAVFAKGWSAALAWLPFRVEQFRETEEALRKEIEGLKSQIATS